MSLYYLSTIINVSGARGIQETNNSLTDDFMQKSLGAPTQGNTNTGPPTTGTYELNFIYIDTNQGRWVCTVAGTPGSWFQMSWPKLSSAPSSPVTGYVYINTTDFFSYKWNGASWDKLCLIRDIILLPAHANQASVTLGNTDGEIGGLTISAAYDQLEVQALRDKCEELADDLRNIHVLLERMRTDGITTGIWKGAA